MKIIKIIITGIFLFSVAACKVTGEAKDAFDLDDEEPSLGVAKRVGNLFTSKTRKENKELRARLERLEKAQQEGNVPVYQPDSNNYKSQTRKENDELRARLERLENAQKQGNVTASQPAPINNGVSISQNGATNFEEWKRARSSSSNDYEEFKEYKEWLEFKKLKKQNN